VNRRRWMGLLLGSLVMLTGCTAMKDTSADTVPVAAPHSDGVLTSGRYTAQQGTMLYLREFTLQANGRVTEVQTVQSTDRFADMWRERFESLTGSMSEYNFAKEEKSGEFIIHATKVHASLAAFNETGIAQVQLLNNPLFRSIAFKAQTGPYDGETMVQRFGAHDQATAEDWVGFLRDAVSVGFVVTDEVTGRTYRWDHTAGEIGTGLPVEIQSKQWRSSAYYGAAVVGAFLLFVVYMGIFGRRHWDTRDEQ